MLLVQLDEKAYFCATKQTWIALIVDNQLF